MLRHLIRSSHEPTRLVPGQPWPSWSCAGPGARQRLAPSPSSSRSVSARSGMAGAFVAVADDATATYWNPAGLVRGGPLRMTIGWTSISSR